MSAMKGKLVLVTGASAGIGEACAKRFAAEGCDLLLVARREERLGELKKKIEDEFNISATTFGLDVRDRDAVERFASEVAAPDILINNAGLASGMSLLHEGDFEDWDRMIDTNVKGLLNVSRLVVPMMVERNSGHVINIGSVAGHLVYPKGNVYNATKFAVRALSEGMNLDLVGTNIRVSSIDPGMTETEFSEVRFHGDKEQARAAYEGFKPLAAEDIADAVFYVASAPEHVSVVGMVILPTAQRSPFVIHRDDN